MLEFRFEFLWPFWLLMRSTFDSFKYQGMGLTILFLCITIFSDVLCFLFLPVHWLFFVASTYVWVQFICNTERGPCIATISLWLLFVYVEASVRLRGIKSAPFNLDLCRPFAAHCIGYPVVSLGYGFKSYVGYKVKHIKQEEVTKQNTFYRQLVSYALPTDIQDDLYVEQKPVFSLTNGFSNKIDCIENISQVELSTSHKSRKDFDEQKQTNLSLTDLEVVTNVPTYSSIKDINKSKNGFHHNESNENGFVRTNSASYSKSNKLSQSNGDVSRRKISKKQTLDLSDEDHLLEISDSESSTARSRHDNSPKTSGRHQPNNKSNDSGRLKDEQLSRKKAEQQVSQLEYEIKKLRGEIQSSKQAEGDSRTQINTSLITERYLKAELEQIKAENESLQQKINSQSSLKCQDKLLISSLERKLKSEKDQRNNLDVQLKESKKKSSKELIESTNHRVENHDSCLLKQQELDLEIVRLQNKFEESCQSINELKKENNNRKMKLSEFDCEKMKKDVDFLTKALNAMQGKNIHLETSLSSETRLKLDLFSALGETRRQYEIVQNQLKSKCNEVDLLKGKIAEVMAVMPPQYHSSLSGFVSCESSTSFMKSNVVDTVVSTPGYMHNKQNVMS